MNLDGAQTQLAEAAEQPMTRLEDKVSWLKRADRMTVTQLKELHADLADRVVRMERMLHHDWGVRRQLKQLKLHLKQKIEERGETTGSVAAVKQAA